MKNFKAKALSALMAAAMVVSVGCPAFSGIADVGAVNAAVSSDQEPNTVDTSLTGSITIHKYDMTAAAQGGVDISTFTATGQEDADAEEALADYAIKGVEFTYLRVGDVEQYTETEDGVQKITLMYEVPSALQDIIGITDGDAIKTENNKDYFTAETINNALASVLSESTNTETKDKLEAYAASGTAMDETDADGLTSVSGLSLGLYLIVETKVPEDVVYTTNPWFVQLPMTDSEGDYWFYDVECYPKNETGVPTLEKKVRNNPDAANVVTSSTASDFTDREEYVYADTCTASEGETLDYYILSKLPHITSTATYLTAYTFEDVLSEGITYGDVKIALYKDASGVPDTNYNNVEKSGADLILSSGYYKLTQKDNTMKVEFTDSGLKLLNTEYSDYYIAIFYTATVDSNSEVVLGDSGNPNDVTLTWKRTSSEYYDILKDECIVYTYTIDLTKEFSDGKGDPSMVQFTLQDTTDGYYLVGEAESDGVYYITGKSATKDGATEFSPASDGKMTVNGIEADTYSMVETDTDSGYSLLKEPVTVVINSTTATITPTEANVTGIQTKSGDDSTQNDGDDPGAALGDNVVVETVAASATVDGDAVAMAADTAHDNSADAIVQLEVTNQKGFTLPQTGGNGVYAVTLLGFAAVAAGLFATRKKKAE